MDFDNRKVIPPSLMVLFMCRTDLRRSPQPLNPLIHLSPLVRLVPLAPLTPLAPLVPPSPLATRLAATRSRVAAESVAASSFDDHITSHNSHKNFK